MLELTARYAKTFGVHNLEVLGGYTYQTFVLNSLNAGAQNFSTDAFGTGQPRCRRNQQFYIEYL
ncbi:MAG: hypothetical protein WDO19_03735 [Bacteroidota bacterium]